LAHILLVANDFPYPLNHGAAVDMWWHIQSLKKLGFRIDIVATVKAMPSEEHIKAVRAEVDQLFIVERKRGFKSAITILPFQVRSRAGLRVVALSRHYEAGVMVAEHVSSILRNPSLRAKKRILRLHNNEVRFFQELSKSSKGLLQKAFYHSEAVKFRMLSPRIMSKCDALWFISDYEMKEHVKKYPADCKKAFFVPPRVDRNGMRHQKLEGCRVLFVGTLGFANNSSAVEWYVSNVHQLLLDVVGYNFVVAGNTVDGSAEAMKKLAASHQSITLYENPKEIESLYGDAAVFVNPVFRGAGLKMKTINAIQAGLPIVTTSTGIEGTGLKHQTHVLVADTPREIAGCIRAIFNDRRMANELVRSAQEFVAREFDQERIIKESLSILDHLRR
jgi:glycosyltransferase involved in cell wall biosynthesis